MCFFFSLIPATMIVVVGYFVLFAAGKAEGTLAKFGCVLAIWIFVIALLPPLAGAYMTVSGGCPVVKMMKESGGWMRGHHKGGYHGARMRQHNEEMHGEKK